MKHLILMAIAIVAMAIMPNSVNASTFDGASTMSTNGNISGTLTVQMGSRTSTFSNFSDLTVTDNGDGTIDIIIDELQIGSMPGKISVNAQSVPTDGSTNLYEGAVEFKLLLASEYDANISANIDSNGKISFTIETVDAKYLGVSFTANVDFVQD